MNLLRINSAGPRLKVSRYRAVRRSGPREPVKVRKMPCNDRARFRAGFRITRTGVGPGVFQPALSTKPDSRVRVSVPLWRPVVPISLAVLSYGPMPRDTALGSVASPSVEAGRPACPSTPTGGEARESPGGVHIKASKNSAVVKEKPLRGFPRGGSSGQVPDGHLFPSSAAFAARGAMRSKSERSFEQTPCSGHPPAAHDPHVRIVQTATRFILRLLSLRLAPPQSFQQRGQSPRSICQKFRYWRRLF